MRSLFAICIILLCATLSQATTILIDPPTGTLLGSSVQFSDLNGMLVNGQSLSLDFLFINGKYASTSGSSERVSIAFSTDFIGDVDSNLISTAYLLNMDGTAATAPITELSPGGISHVGRFGYSVNITGLSPMRYYGVHFEFILPTIPGAHITESRLGLIPFVINVAEPSTLALLLASLPLLVTRRRLKPNTGNRSS